jgi:hypothetical protein
VSTTAISAVVTRRRAVVAGEARSVVSYERPWVRTDVELSDGTGVIVLRFVGRAGVPGFACGRRVVARGTPTLDGSLLVMLNPVYSFEADG